MLSKDQCLKLKEWGLSQSVPYLGRYWAPHPANKIGYIVISAITAEIDQLDTFIKLDERGRYAIPDTKQLLEFGMTKTQEIYGGGHWLLLQSPFADYPHWSAYVTTECAVYDDDEDDWVAKAIDPDIDQAIYKLLEKVIGEQK